MLVGQNEFAIDKAGYDDPFSLMTNAMLQPAEFVADREAEFLVALHHDLLRVRLTEEILAERYREQEMRTPAHFGSGQEARRRRRLPGAAGG